MPDRKQSEHKIRKLEHLGGSSIGLTLPAELIDELGWRAKQKVVVEKKGRHLVIKDWEK